ncbi:unnamed protein product, partial [Allacma fusca]
MQTPGEVAVAFVAAKTRVAPLKALSIPRLELQAAVMGSRLAKTVKEEIQLSISSTVYWSDSWTVISWIRSDSRRYQQFVSHRLGEILESSEVVDWRWVPTDENVADEATRMNKQSEFRPDCRWFQGPAFLREKESSWPKEKEIPEVGKEELKKEFVHVISISEVPDYVPDI